MLNISNISRTSVIDDRFCFKQDAMEDSNGTNNIELKIQTPNPNETSLLSINSTTNTMEIDTESKDNQLSMPIKSPLKRRKKRTRDEMEIDSNDIDTNKNTTDSCKNIPLSVQDTNTTIKKRKISNTTSTATKIASKSIIQPMPQKVNIYFHSVFLIFYEYIMYILNSGKINIRNIAI